MHNLRLCEDKVQRRNFDHKREEGRRGCRIMYDKKLLKLDSSKI
jgi:hypothetical protein